MAIRKAILTAIGLITALSLLLGGCGKPAATTAPSTAPASQTATAAPAAADPFGKYDPPITISTIYSIGADRTFMAGETWDNNIWSKAFEEKLGIKFDYLWSCDSAQFQDKVNVAIATDDLPDYMPALNYDQFYKLAKAGKLADITSAYDQYASPYVKSVLDLVNGIALKEDTVDGKLYGLGTLPDVFFSQYLLFYRDDWAKKLNLQAPKTFDDVVNMAYAFAKGDPNGNGTPVVGMGAAKTILDGGSFSLLPIFAAYKVYPNIWVDDGTGKLVYGGVQPGVKDVLQKLQQWYKDGVLDKDFYNKSDWGDDADDLVKEKIGMGFAGCWFPDFGLKDIQIKHGDKSATWSCLPVPEASGSGTAKSPITARQTNVVCMKAGAAHPEALVKIVNLYDGLLHDPATAQGEYHDQKDADGNTVNNFFHGESLCYAAVDPFIEYKAAVAVQDAIKTGDASKLVGVQQSYYQRAQDWTSGKSLEGYMGWAIYADPNGSANKAYQNYESNGYLMDAYFGPNTDAITANWGNLISKRDELFSKIISGADISEFDNWLNFWNSQGGADITKDVNDWYAANK